MQPIGFSLTLLFITKSPWPSQRMLKKTCLQICMVLHFAGIYPTRTCLMSWQVRCGWDCNPTNFNRWSFDYFGAYSFGPPDSVGWPSCDSCLRSLPYRNGRHPRCTPTASTGWSSPTWHRQFRFWIRQYYHSYVGGNGASWNRDQRRWVSNSFFC